MMLPFVCSETLGLPGKVERPYMRHNGNPATTRASGQFAESQRFGVLKALRPSEVILI